MLEPMANANPATTLDVAQQGIVTTHLGHADVFQQVGRVQALHSYCASDAAVNAKMSGTNALAKAREGGRGVGAVRPQRGFGLLPKLLPSPHNAPQCPNLAFPADTVHVEGEAWLRAPSSRGYALMDLRHRVINQHGEVLVEFTEAITFLPKGAVEH